MDSQNLGLKDSCGSAQILKVNPVEKQYFENHNNKPS